MDADHNRCVLTFAGPPELVAEAALRAVGKAVELIDLTRHTGAHPRIGAADVVPLVPVEGVTMEECVRLAERLGQDIWKRFQVPVYLYEAAARTPERANLENIRRGQFEGLREDIAGRPPDIGEARVHPTAGATVVGARKFLIAYNINLNTPDVSVAKRIAKAIRFSSGGYRYVKAMGVDLASRGMAQVSMNLTDFELTPIQRVFETVRAEAERYGAAIVGSEIVGLVPRKALESAAEFYLRIENFRPDLVLENRLEQVLASGLGEFLDALAAPTATPGGGSAAAAAGAMAAALGTMVTLLAKREGGHDFEADRKFLTEAVERDAAAYQKVLAAYRRPKDGRAPLVEEALREAASVPMEVAERAAAVRRALQRLDAPAKFASDVEVGIALCSAAIAGALANIRINLDSITDEAFKSALVDRMEGGL
jgi:glutamate formiminotransferase